ncbi:MAG: glycerol-3-phosphate dehydrogenase [Alphaproteobacteria bacterium]|nr:glycerol-3-phosphate dehydrogenase [Alphaproteobacteria bacterium]
MSNLQYDLCVIGGGINGAGIARDAAGRGLSVLLVEADDLAGATSSASTKLIHGGLRYLEMYEFGMVREALKERETLYYAAPHLIRHQKLLLPHDPSQRPLWLIRLGLFFYDYLGGRKSVPSSGLIEFKGKSNHLKTEYKDGFTYYDCWGDDSRLVVMNAVDAAIHGARIMTRTKCEGMTSENGIWHMTLRDTNYDTVQDVTARMVVNATGPWVRKFLDNTGLSSDDPNIPNVRLVKGSHLIFPKLYEGDNAYILQQPDKRIVFVIPYEGHYTLIGTTEEAYEGDPKDCMISKSESAYLCEAHNRFFKTQIKPDEAIFSYSGVRPLFDDGSSDARCVTRGYRIYRHDRYDALLLSVFGGKLTTYRALSEAVVNKLMKSTGRYVPAWTAHKPLAGGEFSDRRLNPETSFKAFKDRQAQKYPFLPEEVLERYIRAYGTRMEYILKNARSLDDLGKNYGDQVFEAEINYLKYYEWAQSVDDAVWRRSKLGVHISDETYQALQSCFL